MRSSLGSSVLPTGFRSSSRSRLLPACHGRSPMESARGLPCSVMTSASYCIPPRCSGGSSTGGCTAATGLDADLVAGALDHGIGAQLLAVDADVFRFRHMLTREAVAAELLPPRRVTLAARALAALQAAHPGLPGEAGDLAANLALHQRPEPGRWPAVRVWPVCARPGRARHLHRYATPRRGAAQ